MRIQTWGRFGRHSRLGTIRVRVREDEDVDHTVARSIARRLGLHVVTLREDGQALDERGREVISTHYVTTLGRPVPRRYGGGWTPEAEVWFEIRRPRE